MRYFLFRIDTNAEEVRNEIILGNLRQGWGKSGMSLLKNEEIISKEEWRNNFPEEWDCSDEYINKKYDNLKLMLEIKKNDVIIIPKFPTWDSLSVVKVEEEYKFEMPKVNDYGHCIKIDINSLKSFKYASNTFFNTVHSKLRAYQSPLNNVWNKEVVDAANILLKLESTENTLKELIESIVKKIENDVDKLKENGLI